MKARLSILVILLNPTTQTERETYNTMSTTTRELLPVTEVAIKAQIGLIRNNKQRRRDGEKPVASKNWKLAGLSRKQLRSLLDGETVDRDFKSSGRQVTLTLG